MAGIGFRIQKILKGDSYADSIKAYFYSAAVCSGPWILSILTLFCLSYFAPENIDAYEIVLFRTIIIYIYAFSLIFIGFVHLVLTRYLADKLFQKEQDALIPAFNTTVLATLVFQSIVGMLFFRMTEMSAALQFFSLLTYLSISLIWIVMIFLTALRDYQAVSIAFVAGAVCTLASSFFLGRYYELEGYVAGYFFGQLITLTLLSARIFIEFNSKRYFDGRIFRFFWKHKALLFAGFFYNLAIWIDKIVFWISDRAVEVQPFLRSCPVYDTAVFFAFLTIIPTLSLFIIHVETDFYGKYREYYSKILNHGTYSEITFAKQEMVVSLQRGMKLLVVTQGIITMAAITFAPQIAGLLRMQWIQVPTFRLLILGAYLHGLLLVTIIGIMYFDFSRLACVMTFLFLATNGVFTWITTMLDFHYTGYGYLFSCLVTLVVAYYTFSSYLDRLEYLTFGLQPVGIHREEEIA